MNFSAKRTLFIILFTMLAAQCYGSSAESACAEQLKATKATLKSLNTQGRRTLLVDMAKACKPLSDTTRAQLVGTHIYAYGTCAIYVNYTVNQYGSGTNTNFSTLDAFANILIAQCKLEEAQTTAPTSNTNNSQSTTTSTTGGNTAQTSCEGELKTLKQSFNGMSTEQRASFIVKMAPICLPLGIVQIKNLAKTQIDSSWFCGDIIWRVSNMYGNSSNINNSILYEFCDKVVDSCNLNATTTSNTSSPNTSTPPTTPTTTENSCAENLQDFKARVVSLSGQPRRDLTSKMAKSCKSKSYTSLKNLVYQNVGVNVFWCAKSFYNATRLYKRGDYLNNYKYDSSIDKIVRMCDI